jgi:hypothetical protein
MAKRKPKVFVDSGAFTAMTRGKTISLDRYIRFLKRHKDQIDFYSVLDDINDPEKTLKNQKIMEDAGLKPIPCFHYGEDPKYLVQYLAQYDYVSIGGMVPITTTALRWWLDFIFANFICDSQGIPKTKIHAFGMTTLSLITRYPWFSVDSSRWLAIGRFGSIFIPKLRNGNYTYQENPIQVNLSARSKTTWEESIHIDRLPEEIRNSAIKYIEGHGFKLGKSELKSVPNNYQLGENEVWINKETGEVEKIIEIGLSNDYKQRDSFNSIFFKELEKSIPEWPWPFKPIKLKSFLQGGLKE